MSKRIKTTYTITKLNTDIDLDKSMYHFTTTLNFITKLECRKDWPLNNKTNAIIKIIKFMNYVIAKEHTKTDKNLVDGTVYINKPELINFFGVSYYVKFLDLLKEMQILTAIPHPITGKFYSQPNTQYAHSKVYRIHSWVMNCEDIIIISTVKEKPSFFKNTDVNARFEKSIRTTDIDYNKAIQAEIEHKNKQIEKHNFKGKKLTEQNRLFYKRICRLLNTQRVRFIKRGVNSQRVYNSFSSMTRISRPFMMPHYMSADVKNSQPLIMSSVMMGQGITDIKYKDAVESSLFYEDFYDLSKLEDKDDIRTEVKGKLLKNVYFGFFEGSRYNIRFKELYPITWEWLKETHGKISLAVVLQKLEAEIINNFIPSKGMFFTVFDAIYVERFDALVEACEYLKNAYKALGLNVQIKKEL